MAADTENPLATEVALLGQAVSNMGDDVKEIKEDFKDFKRFYYTKEEAAYLKSEMKTAHNALVGQVRDQFRTLRTIVVGVSVIVLAALILSYVFHLPSPRI